MDIDIVPAERPETSEEENEYFAKVYRTALERIAFILRLPRSPDLITDVPEAVEKLVGESWFIDQDPEDAGPVEKKAETLVWYPADTSPGGLGVTPRDLLFVRIESDETSPELCLARCFTGSKGHCWVKADNPNETLTDSSCKVVEWMLMDTKTGNTGERND